MAKFSLFGNTKALELKIDSYLDLMSESSVLFRSGVGLFLESGGAGSAAFLQKVKQLDELESKADQMRREVEAALYVEALIPDFRADVLSLLEDLDYIINVMAENLMDFQIENPAFPADSGKDVSRLAEQVTMAVEACVMAARAFFRDTVTTRDHIHKVMLFEKEADKVSFVLKTAIFGSDLPLDQKAHLRNFVEKIDQVADEAEDACDYLAIYAIKRAS